MNYARVDRTRETLAGWTGWIIHRVTGYMRRIAMRANESRPENVAVMCLAFLPYASAQAVGLRELGLNVTLYYVDRGSDFTGSKEDRALFLDRARAAGVSVVPVPRRRIRSLLAHTIWLHRDLRRRKITVAIVHSHIDPRYVTLGFIWPVALFVHDPQTHSGDTMSTFPAPIRLIARVSELTSACLIVHSDRLIDQIRPLLRRLPVGVVPHGSEITPAPAKIPKDRQLLIFGRLFPYKGIDTALGAFDLLLDRSPDIKLIVAGRGPLADLARGKPNLELRDEYITEAEIDALLDDVRLVLLPYKDATQSGVGLQAVARGVPCVVSSSGALPELVEDSAAGLVVPPNDPGRLAEAISSYIDHDERLRRAIYDHAAAHFAWPVVAHRLCIELQRLGLDVG